MNTDLHFSSKSDDWSTPDWLFEQLNNEFGFTLDPCASNENAKCSKFYTAQENGLAQDWTKEVVFLNPPYGKVIGDWIDKAIESWLHGATVVALVPARTDTRWFQNCIRNSTEIRFIKGRLKFGGHKNSAPFPSAIVIFKNL